MSRQEVTNNRVNGSKQQSHFSRKTARQGTHFMEPFLSSKMKVGKFTSPLSNKSWKDYKLEVVNKKRRNNHTFNTQPSDLGDDKSDPDFEMADKVSFKGASMYVRDDDSKAPEISFHDERIDPDHIFHDDREISNYKKLLLTPKTISKIMRITKEMVESPRKNRTRAKTKNLKKDSSLIRKKKHERSRKNIDFTGRDARRSNSEKRRVTIDTSNLKVSNNGLNGVGPCR